MKTFILLLLPISLLLFSCKATNKTLEISVANAKKISYEADTFKIAKDTIYVNTNKSVKKVNEKNKSEDRTDETTIEFVGNTNIQKAISENSEIPANAGIGLRFIKKYGKRTDLVGIRRLELDLSITIASTVEEIIAEVDGENNVTNINEFGNSILMPLNSGQSALINFRTFMCKEKTRNIVFGQNWGIQSSFVASNRIWILGSESQNVSTMLFTIGAFSELAQTNDLDNFSICLGLDLSGRWVIGNVGHSYAKEFRKSIIGTDQTFFYGIEPNISIRLKDIRATASVPILFDHEVPGLTKGQFVTMIKFTAGFALTFDNKKSNTKVKTPK